MSLSAEVLNQIAQYRAKSNDGTITIEEMRQAVLLMRENRITAQSEASTKRASGKKKVSSSVADMEAELGLL